MQDVHLRSPVVAEYYRLLARECDPGWEAHAELVERLAQRGCADYVVASTSHSMLCLHLAEQGDGLPPGRGFVSVGPPAERRYEVEYWAPRTGRKELRHCSAVELEDAVLSFLLRLQAESRDAP